MVGACATISARQPGAHLIMGELVVPANAPSAHDSNSAGHVTNLLKSIWLSASLFGQRQQFPPFPALWKAISGRCTGRMLRFRGGQTG
jgi:hypothetical protein